MLVCQICALASALAKATGLKMLDFAPRITVFASLLVRVLMFVGLLRKILRPPPQRYSNSGSDLGQLERRTIFRVALV